MVFSFRLIINVTDLTTFVGFNWKINQEEKQTIFEGLSRALPKDAITLSSESIFDFRWHSVSNRITF
jgi:hypothetical protein